MKKISLVLIVLAMFFTMSACESKSTPTDDMLENLKDAGYIFTLDNEGDYSWAGNYQFCFFSPHNRSLGIQCLLMGDRSAPEQVGVDAFKIFTANGVPNEIIHALASADISVEGNSETGTYLSWGWTTFTKTLAVTIIAFPKTNQ